MNAFVKDVGQGLMAALLVAASATAAAEVKTVNIAYQYGLSYFPLMVMQDQKLLEDEAGKAGLGPITVTWRQFAGGNVMNDATLSGDLQFGSGGVGAFVTLWTKTRNNIRVTGVAAMNNMPLLLNTRKPGVATIKDFTNTDRIALPAAKVSNQALYLQMASEEVFGKGHANQLDHLTVSMSHPDGMAALLSGKSEIDSHFTAPPFQYVELQDRSVHTVLNSYDVMGGPHTFNVVWTTQRFIKENPKTYTAFVKALERAIAFIKEHKHQAAALYVKDAKAKESADFYYKVLSIPDIQFTTQPTANVMKYIDFMHQTGLIKSAPSSVSELFHKQK